MSRMKWIHDVFVGLKARVLYQVKEESEVVTMVVAVWL